MATDNHNSWVEYDVAIEVIGKMIAEQVEKLNVLLRLFERVGFKSDSQQVLTDQDYQKHMQLIAFFKAEIESIYSGKDVTTLLQKVQNVYVPYIKARMQFQKAEATAQSSVYETV